MKHEIKRSAYWDNFKGLLIILVVVGHYLWPYRECNIAGLLVGLIYMFHMPAFIFVSGYLSNPKKAYDISAILKLVISYFIVNTMMMGYSYFVLGNAISLTRPYYSCWYLIALVVWRLVLPCCLNSNRRSTLLISIIFSLLVGFSGEINNKFALARIIAFFPFFIGGSLVAQNSKDLILKLKEKVFLKAIVGVFITMTFLIIGIFAIKGFNINTSDELMQAYIDPLPLDFIKRVVIIFIAINIVLGISLFVIDRQLPLITKFGRNSLTIYLFHRIFSLIYADIFPKETYQEYYIVMALIFSAITILVLGSNFISEFYSKIVNNISFILLDTSNNRTVSKKKFVFKLIVTMVFILIFIEPILI